MTDKEPIVCQEGHKYCHIESFVYCKICLHTKPLSITYPKEDEYRKRLDTLRKEIESVPVSVGKNEQLKDIVELLEIRLNKMKKTEENDEKEKRIADALNLLLINLKIESAADDSDLISLFFRLFRQKRIKEKEPSLCAHCGEVHS